MSPTTRCWGHLNEVDTPSGDKGNKEKKTTWIKRLNDMRKVVMHPAKRQVVSWSELEELDRYKEWLQGKSNDNDNDEDG